MSSLDQSKFNNSAESINEMNSQIKKKEKNNIEMINKKYLYQETLPPGKHYFYFVKIEENVNEVDKK